MCLVYANFWAHCWGLYSLSVDETKKFGYDPKLFPIFHKNIPSATNQRQFYLQNASQICPLLSILVVTELISRQSPNLSAFVLTSVFHTCSQCSF